MEYIGIHSYLIGPKYVASILYFLFLISPDPEVLGALGALTGAKFFK